MRFVFLGLFVGKGGKQGILVYWWSRRAWFLGRGWVVCVGSRSSLRIACSLCSPSDQLITSAADVQVGGAARLGMGTQVVVGDDDYDVQERVVTFLDLGLLLIWYDTTNYDTCEPHSDHRRLSCSRFHLLLRRGR